YRFHFRISRCRIQECKRWAVCQGLWEIQILAAGIHCLSTTFHTASSDPQKNFVLDISVHNRIK
ncbi:hypothetical protein KI387_020027, partial [Taxus chinensis]